jgi:hypothetical protein
MHFSEAWVVSSRYFVRGAIECPSCIIKAAGGVSSDLHKKPSSACLRQSLSTDMLNYDEQCGV